MEVGCLHCLRGILLQLGRVGGGTWASDQWSSADACLSFAWEILPSLDSLLLGCEEAYIGRYIGVVTAWTYLTPMLYVPTDSLSEGRPGLSSFNSSHIGGVESGPSLLRGR